MFITKANYMLPEPEEDGKRISIEFNVAKRWGHREGYQKPSRGQISRVGDSRGVYLASPDENLIFSFFMMSLCLMDDRRLETGL
jgi:hypothetical protein